VGRSPNAILDRNQSPLVIADLAARWSQAADEAERILALSDEQLDKELADAGFDPQELRAKGRGIGERFASEAGLSNAARTLDPKGEDEAVRRERLAAQKRSVGPVDVAPWS
jgi:hypothetical protein